MKQVTRWTPDTHDCVVEYEWDDSVPAEERVHTFKQFVKPLDHARFTGTDQERFDKLMEEHTRKNIALNEVLHTLPDSAVVVVDAQGKPTRTYKEIPKWSIDDEGNVDISLEGFDAATRNAAHAKLVSKFGGSARIK